MQFTPQLSRECQEMEEGSELDWAHTWQQTLDEDQLPEDNQDPIRQDTTGNAPNKLQVNFQKPNLTHNLAWQHKAGPDKIFDEQGRGGRGGVGSSTTIFDEQGRGSMFMFLVRLQQPPLTHQPS